MRDFHLGDILSITTGRLVSPSHMDGVYEILNYVLHDDLFTHLLPRAAEQAKPVLLAQHPQLAAIVAPKLDADTWRAWLDSQVAPQGETLPVEPIAASQRVMRDPIGELVEMVGADRVVLVETPDHAAD